MPEVTPAVSVCIPAYNHAAWIGRTIESVLAQTLGDFEVIVSDDRSTDGTADVAERYRDPRIRVVRNERTLGAAGNWNHVVALARAPFVKLLCDDDLLYPRCLERQVAVLADPRHADVALVCCRRDIVDGDDRRLLTRAGFGGDARAIPGPIAVRRMVRAGTNLVGEPTVAMFRAGAHAAVGGFDGHFAYMLDVDFWCRLLARGSLYVIPEALCAFRVARGSWSTRIASSQAAESRAFFRGVQRARASEIGTVDLLVGSARAAVLAIGRQLLYGALRVPRG
jgi:glycosyltransferase involved in cell wall biosynthesis